MPDGRRAGHHAGHETSPRLGVQRRDVTSAAPRARRLHDHAKEEPQMQTPETHARSSVGEIPVHDLGAAGARLRTQAPWPSSGHSAVSLVHTPDLRIVLLELRAGAHVPEHRSVAPVSMHTIRGRVRLEIADRTVTLTADQLLTIDPDVPHAIHAEEDSALLLTIPWKPDAKEPH
jgi:quercetin dioxygenase-like cupin family protein